MLDVHAPHERMEGFRDFLLHLLTITIGLLIALGLEGCLEWQHHRSLVREAEDGMRGEVAHNLGTVDRLQHQIVAQQKELDADLAVLAELRKHSDTKDREFSFSFQMMSFNDVAWRTAQSTGAMAYMPYQSALTYSDIYNTQSEAFEAEKQVVDGVLRAASFPSTQGKDWKPTPQQIDDLTNRIGELRMRLMLLNSLVNSLGHTYQDFQAKEK
jgi:hypothetical protein